MINQSDINLSGKVFQAELFSLVKGLVWKNRYRATKEEKNVDQRQVDQFMAANKGYLTFETIFQFDEDIIRKMGIPEEDIWRIMDNREYVPYAMRDTITKLQIEKYLELDPVTKRYRYYEEENNYYRMLYGLPNVEDEEFIYINDNKRIDPNIPVHLLELSDCIYLEDIGYCEKWKEEHPDKEYLQYIGKKRIDPYISRSANRFEILWMNERNNTSLVEDFRETYEESLASIIRIYYRDDFNVSNTYYEEFMAMCVLFTAINKMFYKYLETDTTREFYDLESLKQIYESYGVPFYPEIPVTYHKKIVKKMNKLLSYKGSTRVFFELFDIFDIQHIDIYQYYLMKQHKTENNKPIFVYDKDGKINKNDSYTIKMGQVRLYDNPPLELSDPMNQMSYNSIIAEDPYWISDQDLMNKLYETEFNYLETKYLGIRTTFDMMSIVYECAYFIKMIEDNRDELELAKVYYSFTNYYHTIFSIIIYLCSLVCKKHGYEGLISEKLSITAKYLGYNFKADITELRELILSDISLQKDTELIKVIDKINVSSLESITAGLQSIYNLRLFLFDRMCSTRDPHEYTIYSHLYKTLLTSDYVSDIFRLPDGSIAETFSDLLQSIDSPLFVRLSSLEDKQQVEEELSMVYGLLFKTCTELKYLNYADGLDVSPLIDQIFLLLKFFKSAKAELTGYNIIYTISTPYINYMKLLGIINSQEHEQQFNQDHFHYLDDVATMIQENTIYLDMFRRLSDQFQDGYAIYNVESRFKWITDILWSQYHYIYYDIERVILTDVIAMEELYDTIYSVLLLADGVNLFNEFIDYEAHEYRVPNDELLIGDNLTNDQESSSYQSVAKLHDKIKSIILDYGITHEIPIYITDKFKLVGEDRVIRESICLSMKGTNENSIYSPFSDRITIHDRLIIAIENKMVNNHLKFSDQCILIDEEKV